MKYYSSFILYLKYVTMYFLEDEIHIFLLGPLVNIYASGWGGGGGGANKWGCPRH